MNTYVTDHTNRYWGFWATALLGVLIFLVFSVIQALGLLSYVYTVEPNIIASLSNPESGLSLNNVLNKFLYNGDAIAVAEIPAAFIGCLMILWFVRMRRPLSIDQYLELYIPKLRPFLLSLALMILIIVIMEIINYFLEIPTPEFMIQVYSNTQNMPLLWLAVVVAAPFFEEFLFRGFLLEGFSRSKLGVVGAVILTSATWAIIHMQYGWFEITSIFFIGIALCITKIKSKSLYVPIAMHMLMNLTASIGMELSL